MKHKSLIVYFIILVTLSASFVLGARLLGAYVNAVRDSKGAKQNLIAFFDFLNRGQYNEAAELYEGSYEILVEFNPALDPENFPALLKNGCEINGLQCLTVLTAEFKEKNSKGEYIFLVQFKDADGNLFVQQTPNMPPVFIFEYRVMKGENGTFRMLDLPPYVH